MSEIDEKMKGKNKEEKYFKSREIFVIFFMILQFNGSS